MLKIAKKYYWLPQTILLHYTNSYQALLIDVLLENAISLKDLGLYFDRGLYEKEVRYLLKHEWVARTSEEILWRRTKLGLTFTLIGGSKVV